MSASKTPWQSCDGHRPDTNIRMDQPNAPSRDRLGESDKKEGSILGRLLKGHRSKPKS